MIGLFKKPKHCKPLIPQAGLLGPLEISVMEVLWSRGKSNVREVVDNLERTLAYTTVMTTLDRLFKKGLLERQKLERAYIYSPALTRKEWEHKRAEEFVMDFVTGAKDARQTLVSCFLDVIVEYDTKMLDELEHKIQIRRRQLLDQSCS